MDPKTAASTASSYAHPSINAGGALDVIFVAHAGGGLASTDWHVVFERLSRPGGSLLGSWGYQPPTPVQIHINGTPLKGGPHLHVSAELEPATFLGTCSQSPPAALLAAALPLLADGCNELRYTAGEDGGPCVRAFLYLWCAGVPAVVFDVDGTVTLDDLVGQAGALFDTSPTHAGAARRAPL
jgi:hypothetical protein